MSQPGMRVAIDVGGTFTDLCVFERAGVPPRVAKVPSTAEPVEGILNALKAAEVPMQDVAFFAHGTTVATNALLTRTLARTAMVTTEGFRDVIEIRRGTKENIWDVYRDPAPPPIRRRDRFGVKERLRADGTVHQPLDDDQARAVARRVKDGDFEAVAVCFINAYANSAHEERMREILTEECPGVDVSLSSEILPQIFEHDRFSTTVTNAVLAPRIGKYVGELEGRLRESGYDGDVLLLHSGGGVLTSRSASRFSSRLASSGIVAGALAARHIAVECGCPDAIGLDMGGTSTDVSLIHHGELRTTPEWSVEYGYPIAFPSVEVLTIGSGGGSIAWIDQAGSLRNGPQSAGAIPGPACYNQGGELPTNTDANLVLGRLGDGLVGGGLKLDREAAYAAIAKHVATPLDLGVEEAAAALLRVANSNMADAVRIVSVRRGHDPRDFALVAFGGAGPLHGVDVARELQIPTVIVPAWPGVTSALGCLLVDVRHDISSMLLKSADDVDLDEIDKMFAGLKTEAHDRLQSEGVAESERTIEFSVDMRYVGQWRSLTVDLGEQGLAGQGLPDLVRHFHEEHGRTYNIRRDEAPVELFRLNVRAIGRVETPDLRAAADASADPSPVARRSIIFDVADGAVDSPVYDRTTFVPGFEFEGPAVVSQLDSTVLVPPQVKASVDDFLNIRLNLQELIQ